MQAAMKVLGIDNVFVPVGNLAEAIAFYGDLLGVATLAEPFQIPTGWAFEIRDPWGNVLGFTDYTSKPELGRA
jgi:predicted enzyme related to lactoylglutathione lyase